MPGRTAVRSARPSTSSLTSNKVSHLLCATKSTSTSPASIFSSEQRLVASLRLQICAIFADAQKSTAGHRSLVARLRKIQEACCYLPAQSKRLRLGTSEDFGEEDFNSEISRCTNKVLVLKKTEAVGDRIVRFLGVFLKTATEKDLAIALADESPEETQAVPETPSSRLTFYILSTLIPLLSAKEKAVRFRATQIISHVVNSLESIDDELYYLIRQGLSKRIRDKESTIRIQAVMGLGRLAGNETENVSEREDSEEETDSSGLLDKLLDVLQHDASSEVRRTLLLNLPLTPSTLPYLLERARDLDSSTRRALYARLLPTLGDFRHLSLSMREKLLRWGLRDRDENVRKSASRLFRERWVEDCAGLSEESGHVVLTQKMSPPSSSGLLELLERIDVVNSGVDGGIALEAMKDFWEGRPDYLEAITFTTTFWDSLTPEAVFMARTFNDHCQQHSNNRLLGEEKMPEVARLGFYIQKYMNSLLDSIKRAAECGEGEEETAEQEFVVEQLLHIALTLDYSDEIGRRKIFSLLREALSMPDLPEEVTRLAVEVLRLVCGPEAAGEREFCGIVLEAIAEVHDNILSTDPEEESADSFVSAKSHAESTTPTDSAGRGSLSPEEEEQRIIKEIMVNMKCLHIAQCMLQNVDGNLQQNMHLVTMLNNLVVPAVRSHEAPIRERGLICLGLCCLLDRTLAEENMTLLIHCFSRGHEALQAVALQILCDMLTTHPSLLSTEIDELSQPPYQKMLLKSIARAMKPSSPASIQSAAGTSLCKLLLTARFNISDPGLDELLRALVVLFFDPRTTDNATLRQALAYFLPVYCHSRVENCGRISRVAVAIVHEVIKSADEYFTVEAEENSDGDVDESAADKKVKSLITIVIGMLSEWSDQRRVISLEDPALSDKNLSGLVVLKLAEDILERCLTAGCHGQEKKALLIFLSKLYIAPPTAEKQTGEREIAGRVKDLLDEALSDGLANDASGKNTLIKAKNAILKIVKGFSPEGSVRDGGSDEDPAEDRGEVEEFADELSGMAIGDEETDRKVTSVVKTRGAFGKEGGDDLFRQD